jgi:hypothetical protein
MGWGRLSGIVDARLYQMGETERHYGREIVP